MFILNSSGLVVQVPENVPTVTPGAWGTPSWPKSSLGDPLVAPALAGANLNLTGVGAFSLGTTVSGLRGTISSSFVVSTAGTARTVWYLTDNLATPTNRITLSIDTSNRPFVSIRNASGTVVALVTPSYTAIPAGARVEVFFSWDSTVAIDGTRFAVFRVNSVAVASGDWATNPIAAWPSFTPAYAVLATSASQADFNGQIVSVQISNRATPV